MPKRTQVEAYDKITRAEDVEKVVKDKRTRKRASKQKGTQRNRRYEKRLLRHLQQYGFEEE